MFCFRQYFLALHYSQYFSVTGALTKVAVLPNKVSLTHAFVAPGHLGVRNASAAIVTWIDFTRTRTNTAALKKTEKAISFRTILVTLISEVSR